MRQPSMLAVGAIWLLLPGSLAAQDPVTIDPKHYKVELENENVRVLRVTYGPGEKSPMHAHPPYVGVFLTDGRIRFALPDGTTAEHEIKRGATGFAPAESHAPENIGSAPFELIAIELKTPAGRRAEGLPNNQVPGTRPAKATKPRR